MITSPNCIDDVLELIIANLPAVVSDVMNDGLSYKQTLYENITFQELYPRRIEFQQSPLRKCTSIH